MAAIVCVDPDAMCRAEAGSEQPQLVEVGDQAFAIAALGDDGLQLRLRDVHLDANVELGCQVTAFDQELIGAVMRDGRAERRTKVRSIPLPALENRATGSDRLRMRRILDLQHGLAQLSGRHW
jgi:hypothetical protein